MLVKNERENIFNYGWIESYKLKDYDSTIDDDEIIKIVASTIYQKDSDTFKNIEKLKERLNKEAALNTPSRVYEFIPRVYKMDVFNYTLNNQQFLKYSYNEKVSTKEFTSYTNLRNSIKNNSNGYFKLNSDTDLYEKFFIVKMYIPMFIRDQFMTHTQLSKLNRSYRVSSQKDNKYWYPEDFKDQLHLKMNMILNKDSDNIFGNTQHVDLVKDLGYPKEIYTRFDTQNRYGEMIMAGWMNDENGWKNFFLERGCIPNEWSNWVQIQTNEVAKIIYKQSKI